MAITFASHGRRVSRLGNENLPIDYLSFIGNGALKISSLLRDFVDFFVDTFCFCKFFT